MPYRPVEGHPPALLRGVHAHRRDTMCGADRPDRYDARSGRFVAPLHHRIAADVAAAGPAPGALVVDVGTGPGRLPLLVAAACPGVRCEGVDPAEAMVRHARGRLAAWEGPGDRVGFRVAGSGALPYPDASVDLVVSSLSVHHWADVPGGLAEVRRVLRPGGRAWLYDLRGVLRRTAAEAGLAAPEPLGPAVPQRRGDRVLAAVLGRLVGRLEVLPG